MPEYRRPSLVTADMIEVSEHLLGKGVQSSLRRDATAMIVTIAGTSAELDTALVDFPNLGFWRKPLPGDLPTHAAHIAQIRAATPAQLAAMTDAQVRHAVQDLAKAIALLIDDRLG